MTPGDPDAIVAAARARLGVPCRHRGRTRQGVDCAGLVVLVGRGLGLADYDTTAYGRRPEGQGFVQHFCAAMDGVPLPEAKAGDALVFADAAYPCDCGFLAEKHEVPHLLHAHALRRKVIEEPYGGEWPLKAKFTFRFRASAAEIQNGLPSPLPLRRVILTSRLSP